MERDSVFSSLFLDVAGDTGAFRGIGLLRILRTVEAEMLLIFDLMQPPVESRSGDAKILSHPAPWYLECFHLPKDEKPFSKCMSRLFLFLFDAFLKD